MQVKNFISTKLKTPPPRRAYVAREQLLERMRLANDCKIMWVQGHAGMGKTTLVTSYLAELASTQYAWVSLDETNNTALNFWNYILEALRPLLGDSYEQMQQIFENIMKKEDVQQLLSVLVNLLAEQECNTEHNGIWYLVLDDFHALSEGELLQTIEFFLKYSPEYIKLIVTSRKDASLYLGDWLVAGKVLLISENDLLFSEEEGEQFLRETLGMQIAADTSSHISSLAEGWVGGLQLLGIAHSQGRELKNKISLDNAATNYLTREIYDSLSIEEKEFLLITAQGSYFDLAWCEQVLLDKGHQHITEMLELVLEKHLFISKIEAERDGYRYHAIFREVLHKQFSKQTKEWQAEYIERAAKAYLDQDDIEEAIRLYEKSGNYTAVLDIITKFGQNPRGWLYLSKVPIVVLVDNYELTYQRLFYHYCNYEIDEGRRILNYIESTGRRDEFHGMYQLSRAFIEENFDWDLMSVLDIDQLSLSDVTKAIVYLKFALYFSVQDKFREALQYLEKARRLETNMHNLYIRHFVKTFYCQIQEMLGNLSACDQIYAEVYAMIADNKLLEPIKLSTNIAYAGVYIKRYQLDEAEKLLNEAKQMASKYQYEQVKRGYEYNEIEWHIIKGNHERAMQMVEELEREEVASEPIYMVTLLMIRALLGTLREVDIEGYLEWYHNRPAPFKPRLSEQVVYAEIKRVKGEQQEALETIDHILAFARQNQIHYIVVYTLLLKLVVLSDTASERDRINIAREAIFYSWQERIISPFVIYSEAAPAFLMLLSKKINGLQPKEVDFTKEVIQIMGLDCDDELTDLAGNYIDSILTEREREVLEVMVTGASNKEIADKLCISVATVKTHIINIYSKTGVKNRVEALEWARGNIDK